jgi:cyclic pyranopterin phosphate synthase
VVRASLRQRFTLTETDYRTGGPSRYFTVRETDRRVGFITPMTHNFCASCNRVRLTVTGTLFMCLGQDDSADLRRVLRGGADDAALEQAVRAAIARKPKGHEFFIDRARNAPSVRRHMSLTGG